MASAWAELPTGRVVRLTGADAEAIALAIEPLPEAAPAIITCRPRPARTTVELVTAILDELERIAIGLFPAWLPGATGITGTGGANVPAVRALALRAAAAIPRFAPFLADLAERSLRRTTGVRSRFAPEVRAGGLARVLATAYQRRGVAILMNVPARLSPAEADVLAAACDWLAYRGGYGVWLTGGPLPTDRVETVTITLPAELELLRRTLPPTEHEDDALPVVGYPPIAGQPHPASTAEQTLERALAECPWAAGRAWNQTYQSDPLVNPIRIDLLWRAERLAVEIDGPEHGRPLRRAADQQRDLRLSQDGYVVLRFTNDHVLTDIDTVLDRLRRILEARRSGTLEGIDHVRHDPLPAPERPVAGADGRGPRTLQPRAQGALRRDARRR